MVEEAVRRVCATTPLGPGAAARVVEEVLALLTETLEEYVRRRHRELQADGLTNPAIFALLETEIPERRFSAGAVSQRRLRRIVYG